MPLDASTYYIIRSLPNGPSVMVVRGEEAPKITGGGARWNTIERPRRTSMVQWVGNDPYSMDLSIMIDGWVDGRSVENDVAKINQMFHSPADLAPPRPIVIEGAVPVKGARWIISSIDWGDRTIWQPDGRGKGYRTRQDAVLHLLQFVPETTLKKLTPTTGLKIHTVKAGETGRNIARKHGVTTAAIKKANNKRDLKTLKTGDKIKIPPTVSGSYYANLPSVNAESLQPANIDHPRKTDRKLGLTQAYPGLKPSYPYP